MKKSFIFTIFLLFSFLLLNINLGHARLGPEDYWNKYVKDQYVPEAIKGMLLQDPAASASDVHRSFVRNFDPRRFDAVVYHTHDDHSHHPKMVNKPPSDQLFDKLKENR